MVFPKDNEISNQILKFPVKISTVNLLHSLDKNIKLIISLTDRCCQKCHLFHRCLRHDLTF